MPMRFEWDEAKNRTNIGKHGIGFRDAKQVFAGLTVTIRDDRVDYGEERFITLGTLRGHVIVIVHTESDEVIRMISARKATTNEATAYYEEID